MPGRRKKKRKLKGILLLICLFLILIYIFLFSPILKDKETDSEEIEHGEEIGIVCKGETIECFYIDEQGIAFEQAPQTSGSLVLSIKDYSDREYYLGKQVFKEHLINFILQAKQGLFSDIGLRSLDFSILSWPAKDLKVVTNEGWYIVFDLETDIKNQILSLKTVLEQKIQDRGNLEYVDLRIENRIYYK